MSFYFGVVKALKKQIRRSRCAVRHYQ